MRGHLKQWFLASICLVAIWSSVQAQSPDQLDSIATFYDLSKVIVTAQYAPTHSKNAVHKVKVIESEEIQARGLTTLTEVLRNEMNMRINVDPILGDGLSLQGISGENVQILVDGVPIIGRLNGNIDLSQVPMAQIARIEIIEGAMSAQYGSNASGGVINLITRSSQTSLFEIESQNQFESVGIIQNNLSAGIQNQNWYLGLQGGYFKSQLAPLDSLRVFEKQATEDGDPFKVRKIPWNPKTQFHFGGKLAYRKSDSLRIRYQTQYFQENLQRLGEIRRPQFLPYAFDENYRTVRYDNSLHIRAYLNPKWYFKSISSFNQFSREKKVSRKDIETDTSMLLTANLDTNRFNSLLHRTILSQTGESKVNTQFGIELLRETGSGQRIADTTEGPFNEARIFNASAWISLKYTPLPEFTILGQLRYGYNTRYEHPMIPSIHARWRPSEFWDFRLSYAKGFRAPSLKELYFNFIDVNHYIIGNQDLKAENAHNVTFSGTHILEIENKHTLNIEGELFYNYIDDRIVLAEFQALQYTYRNLDHYQTHGLNLELRYQFSKKNTIKTGFGYTRMFNPFSEEYSTDKFNGLMEWQNELVYMLPIVDLRFDVTHRYIGRQVRFFESQEGQLEQGFIGGFHFLNISASRPFWNDHIFVSLGVKNLLDKQTVPVVNGGSGQAHSNSNSSQLLNWGRTYFLKVNLKFSY